MDHYREIVRKLNAPSIASILADFAREDGRNASPTASGSPLLG